MGEVVARTVGSRGVGDAIVRTGSRASPLHPTIPTAVAPYLGPLFILPFHLPTVYAINIVLVGWAAWLHSSGPTPLHWALQSPLLHNAHHASGIRNGNYAPIFTHLDRLFGTLRDTKLPPWMAEEAAAAAAVAKKAL